LISLKHILKFRHLYPLFRFYLGLALALKKDGPGGRVKEAVSYLLEAFETLMTERTKHAMTTDPESWVLNTFT